MKDSQLMATMEVIAEYCGNAILEKRYHESIMLGTLGYALFHESGHKVFARGALGFVSDAILHSEEQTLPVQNQGKPSEQPSCSFCGRSEPDVKLAAGPVSYICDSCVATLSEVFARGKDEGGRS